jgi:hypothetical protein
MNTQLTPSDEQIAASDLVAFSLEELEGLLRQISLALEKTFHEMSGSAQGATHAEAQRLRVLGWENDFKRLWEDLQATVDAIIYHAVFAEQYEQKWNNLTQRVCEEMELVEAVTSGQDITSEWLARRDVLAGQVALLLGEDSMEEVVS